MVTGAISTGRLIGQATPSTFASAPRRDIAAAKAFFRKPIKRRGSHPRTVTLDGYAASHGAVREMRSNGELPADTKLGSAKCLNNLIGQDHRGVKLRSGPMLGFKRFKTAEITIAGIRPRSAMSSGSTCACYLGCSPGSL